MVLYGLNFFEPYKAFKTYSYSFELVSYMPFVSRMVNGSLWFNFFELHKAH